MHWGLPDARKPQMTASADRLDVKPADDRHAFHYRGDSRGLITAIAASYGLTVVFDDGFPSRRVRFDLDYADFATAMQAASQLTKSFSVALEDKVLFAAAENGENHRLFDRMGMRSFYISGGNPQDLNLLMNSLRTLFEFKFVSVNAAANIITIRGPQAALEGATQFLEQLDSEQPEVLLELKVFQVSHTYMRNIGLHAPDNFNLFNIPVAALAALGGQKHSNPDQPVDRLRRHQPGWQSVNLRSPRPIAGAAEFNLQSAPRDFRRRAHAGGTEPGSAIRHAIDE